MFLDERNTRLDGYIHGNNRVKLQLIFKIYYNIVVIAQNTLCGNS